MDINAVLLVCHPHSQLRYFPQEQPVLTYTSSGGYANHGGQCRNPYNLAQDPEGSSCDNAVAAGFPFGLGIIHTAVMEDIMIIYGEGIEGLAKEEEAINLEY